MKEENLEKKHVQRLIFISGALFFLVVLVVIVVQVMGIRKNNDYDFSIIRFDIHLEDGMYVEAEQDLLSASQAIQTAQEALGVLKRFRLLYEEIALPSDWQMYLEELLALFPGNQRLRGFIADMYLQQHKDDLAYEIAKELTDPLWVPLKIESTLKTGRGLDRELLQQADDLDYAPIQPQQFTDPNTFLEAFSITRDIRYLLNATLLLLSRGNLTRAHEALQGSKEYWKNPKFANQNQDAKQQWADMVALVSRDALSPHEAYLSLKINGDTPLYEVELDLLVLTGRIQEALHILQQSFFQGDLNEIGYHNYYWLLLERLDTHPERMGDHPISPREIVEKGLQTYPSSSLLTKDLLWYHLRRGELEQAKILANSTSTYEHDPIHRLLHVLYQYQVSPDLSIIPKVWNLYNDSDFNPDIGGLLGYLLWTHDDRSGLSLLIDLTKARRPYAIPDWVSFYEGLLLVKKNEYLSAIDSLEGVSPSLGRYRLPLLRLLLAVDSTLEESSQILEGFGVPMEVAGYTAGNSQELQGEWYNLHAWFAVITKNYRSATEWYQKLLALVPEHNNIPRLRYWIEQARITP